MRLGLSVGPFTHDLAVEEGIKGVPLNNAVALLNSGVDQVLAPLKARGLEVCQIALWSFNPLAPDRQKQEALRKQLEQIIPLLPATGHPSILLNAGNHGTQAYGAAHRYNFTDRALDDAARALAPLAKLAETHGVTVLIEPFVQNVISTPERFLVLKEKVGSDALMCNLDLCNFYTFQSMMNPTETARHVCETLGGHYTMAHVKDLAMVPGVHIHIDEAPFGTGVSDWVTALGYMARDLPEDGWVILEHAKTLEDARLGLKNLRAAAATAGVTLQ